MNIYKIELSRDRRQPPAMTHYGIAWNPLQAMQLVLELYKGQAWEAEHIVTVELVSKVSFAPEGVPFKQAVQKS